MFINFGDGRAGAREGRESSNSSNTLSHTWFEAISCRFVWPNYRPQNGLLLYMDSHGVNLDRLLFCGVYVQWNYFYADPKTAQTKLPKWRKWGQFSHIKSHILKTTQPNDPKLVNGLCQALVWTLQSMVWTANRFSSQTKRHEILT